MDRVAQLAQHQAALFKSNTQSINYQQALKASAEQRRLSLWQRIKGWVLRAASPLPRRPADGI